MGSSCNALGAWLSGIAIAVGLGLTSPIWVGAAVTVSGLIVLVIATAMDHPDTETPPVAVLAGR